MIFVEPKSFASSANLDFIGGNQMRGFKMRVYFKLKDKRDDFLHLVLHFHSSIFFPTVHYCSYGSFAPRLIHFRFEVAKRLFLTTGSRFFYGDGEQLEKELSSRPV